MRVIMVLVVIGIAGLLVGCSSQTNATISQTLKSLTEVAQAGNVQGTVRARINGVTKAVAVEGIEFGNPGSSLDVDLTFKFADDQTMDRK